MTNNIHEEMDRLRKAINEYKDKVSKMSNPHPDYYKRIDEWEHRYKKLREALMTHVISGFSIEKGGDNDER